MLTVEPRSYRAEGVQGVGSVVHEEAERVAAALRFAVVFMLAGFASRCISTIRAHHGKYRLTNQDKHDRLHKYDIQ